MDQHDLAATQFGAAAAHYLTSSVHASGADLDRLTNLAGSDVSDVLDLGCGAGHASYALARAGARRVVAYDLSPQMLDVVATEAARRGHAQIETCVGPAEHLAFADASFDMVVTRYSAHHWLDVPGALWEVARILKTGGKFLVIDVIAPESPLMDTVLQTVELLRDVSHVRDYRESEWHAMLEAANFSNSRAERWKLPMEFKSWVARIGTSPPRIEALKHVFDALPMEAREYFAVTGDNSFAIDSAWFETIKR
jgi:ubiquinone/menaquinone biosynthesis C-methylase UbiE